MKTCLWFFMLTGMAIGWSARAQGTLVFDQQSSTIESGLEVGLRFQGSQPFAQSFVPTLSSIGFVRLFMFPGGPESQNATVYVNVLSDSVTGPTLGSTAPLTIPNYLAGYMNFYFTTPVTLHPGTTYYLQPVATAGDPVTDVIGGNTYPNGSLFISGVEHVGEALWFREGIVVPEPATVSLSLVAGSLLLWRWRKSVTV